MAQCICTLLMKEEQLMDEQSELSEYKHEDGTVGSCKILALTFIYLILANLMKLPYGIFLFKG